jgi:hypothetical protein
MVRIAQHFVNCHPVSGLTTKKIVAKPKRKGERRGFIFMKTRRQQHTFLHVVRLLLLILPSNLRAEPIAFSPSSLNSISNNNNSNTSNSFNWYSPSTWNTSTVPTADDSVIFDPSGASNITLYLNRSTTVQALVIKSGTVSLEQSAILTVAGEFEWHGGTLATSVNATNTDDRNATFVAAGTLTLSTAADKTLAFNTFLLVAEGASASWADGGDLVMGASSVFENRGDIYPSGSAVKLDTADHYFDATAASLLNDEVLLKVRNNDHTIKISL